MQSTTPHPETTPVTVLLLGCHGMLGTAWRRAMRLAGNFNLIRFGRGEMNLTNPNSFERTLGEIEFDVLINAAAYTSVDDCEFQGELPYLVNGQAPGLLAKICARRRVRMIHFSTDFVFDGQQTHPYTEEDAPKPISVYGKSKLMGEQLVCEASDEHVVVRLSWLFGPGRPGFPEWVISRAKGQEKLEVVSDKTACPTYSMDAANALLPWVMPWRRPGGIWHYCQPEACAWNEYAQHILDCAHQEGIPLRATKVSPISIAELPGLIAPRPPRSALDTAKFTAASGHPPRPWREALAEYLHETYGR